MKRRSLCFFTLAMLLPLLFLPVGCKKKEDYSAYLSDIRCDIFRAETDLFTVTVSCMEREHPFAADGIVSDMCKTVEVVLAEKTVSGAEYEVYFLEDMPRGGDMSFRNVTGDHYFSRGVEEFPTGSLSLRIVSGDKIEELFLTSVKSENTLTPKEALSFAVEAEKDTIARMTNETFGGEFHVRLIRRDKNYYYVGIVHPEMGTVSLLLDAETGAVLARRESNK